MKAVVFMFLGVFLTTNVYAKTELELCYDKAMSTVEMYECQKTENEKQDKRLNQEYQKLMGELRKDQSEDGKEIVERAVKAQRSWITFRDASCDLEGAQMLGGSGQISIVMGCVGRMTKERADYIVELQKMFLTEGGTAN